MYAPNVLLEIVRKRLLPGLVKEGTEWRCLCPFHKEKTPSFTIFDDEKGGHGHCFGCGWHGDAVDFMVRDGNLSVKEAIKRRDEMLGTPIEPPPKGSRPEKGSTGEKRKFREQLPSNATARYDYIGSDFKLKFVVLRYDREDGSKFFASYYRAKKGAIKGWASGVRPDVADCRPLYRLPELIEADKARQVMVVEGEGVANAVAGFNKKVVVCAWSGGTEGWPKTDFTPLHGRSLLLVADEDKPGRKAMTRLAEKLAPHCKVSLCLPDGDSGDDLVQVIARGRDQVMPYLKKWAMRYQPPKSPQKADKSTESGGKKKPGKEPPKPPPPPDEDGLANNRHFDVLGNVDSTVIIKIQTQQLLGYSRTAMTTPATLLSIAPDPHWWSSVTHTDPPLSRPVAMGAGATLIRLADKKGQIDMSRVHNRGCLRNEQGEVVWHLGNRLVVDGREQPLNYPDGNIYVSGPRIDIAPLEEGPLDTDTKSEIAEAVLAYRWLDESDGKRMLGWIVASLIGGILEWRPHIWLLGPSEQGKSWFIKEIMLPLHWTATRRLAAPTEATVARAMGSSPLPLVLEEAEPDRTWINAVVELCRISAGGEGERTRADGMQGVISTSPQFSVCMCSTKLPRLAAADNQRFVLVRLSPVGVPNWPKVEKQITNLLRRPSKMGAAFRASMVHQAGEIAARADEIARELMLQGVSARASRIRGALSAGWEWWSGDRETLAAESPRSKNRHADAAEVLLEILGHRVRTPRGEDATLLEMALSPDQLKLAMSYGVKIIAEGLLIAPSHPGVARTVSRSRFSGSDLQALLMQLEGVEKRDTQTRFGDGFKLRPILFPNALCDAMGIDLSEHYLNKPGAAPANDETAML